jgi:(E)-4-hydroxy-3-methylbut-2-enyl-diphosphate synthase
MIIDELTSQDYCNSTTAYARYKTRVVDIGGVPMGGDHPIRVQSMTTTNTMDTEATVLQSIRMIEAGCEYVRITAPSQNEARNLENIKNELHKRGHNTPLVADIHFTPNAAEIAAQIVEKVRINPGNYADRKKFAVFEYTDAEYALELERIREKFLPLVEICKEHRTAMRIGTNHGSLSDRIMNRFGDTPIGMVESALEFARICGSVDYHEIVFSMKASNPQVVIQAYRLLVNRMEAEGMNYPLHLGVTEAGDGEDGRIKSAVGIGALLEDGLGDTIRVSLTEEPEAEVPVCISLVNRYRNREDHRPIPEAENWPINPFGHHRRQTQSVDRIGGDNVPVVILPSPTGAWNDCSQLSSIGYDYDPGPDKWNIGDQAADFIYTADSDVNYETPGTLSRIMDAVSWSSSSRHEQTYPLWTLGTYNASSDRSARLNFVDIQLEDVLSPALVDALDDNTCVLVISTDNSHAMAELRRASVELINRGVTNPIIFRRHFTENSLDEVMLFSATDFGGLINEGLGDGIWLDTLELDAETTNRIAFGILQATRTRISKTEYISCPSCGRTLFDLQETTALIRGRTSHLKGLKIGIMGCIVNGPGEMADADYGYVGSGPGQITLYRGQEVVKRNMPTEGSVDELIELIRGDGNWVEPE